MRHIIEAAIVRVLGKAGTPVGAGLLVGESEILTCAHVVREALGLKTAPTDAPQVEIRFDLPLLGEGVVLASRVILWQPDPEVDIAALEVTGPLPDSAKPLPILSADDYWEHRFRVFGFPKGREAGVWARGALRGPQAHGWLQIDAGDGGYRVEPGFSGSPVWDETLGGVIGLVTRSDMRGGVRAAYVIPAQSLTAAWPRLSAVSRAPSPYRGLAAFREIDAVNFFGREDYTNRLVKRVNQSDLVTVIGPSGSGKSSAVFAGLVPALRNEGPCLVVDFRPGRRPFRSLASALLPKLEPDMGEIDRLREAGKLAAALECGDVALAEVLARIHSLDSSVARTLLVVDQFEELYALGDDLEHQRRFLDMLLFLSEGGPVRDLTLCLTLRADFMGQALSYRPFADRLQDSDVKLGPMNRDELHAAIVQPASRLGIAFEPGLVDRILDDVGHEPGNLPLLQFALLLLWDQQYLGHLTHEAYNAVGQVQGALALYADQVYERLPAGEKRRAARPVFTQLVQPGSGTADTRRLATRDEIGEGNWPLVQQLADERLLVTGANESGQETVEVVHEALIQHWGRLQDWMAEDRVFREWQQRLRSSLKLWEASQRDSGALLRGAPLAEAEEWLEKKRAALPAGEIEFIHASLKNRRAETQAEAERIREQESLAQERANAGRFRRLTRWLSVVVALAIIGAAAALIFMNQAQQESTSATSARSTSDANAGLAATREIEAVVARTTSDANAGLAATREIEAVVARTTSDANAILASTSEAQAIEARATAEFNADQVVLLKDSIQASQLAAASIVELDRDPELALMLAVTGLGVGVQPDAVASLHRTLLSPYRASLRGHTSRIKSVTFSADGQKILTSSTDGTARVWDLAGNEMVRLEGHEGWVNFGTFGPGATSVLTGSDDRSARLWDLNGNEVAQLRVDGMNAMVDFVSYSPDGQKLLTIMRDGATRIWDLNGNPLFALDPQEVSQITLVSPDGSRFLTHERYQTPAVIRVWGWEGNQMASFEIDLDSYPGFIVSGFSADGTKIATISGQDPITVRLWSMDGDQLATVDVDTPNVFTSAVSPDGSKVIVTNSEANAWLIDMNGGTSTRLVGHTDLIDKVIFSYDGNSVMTGARDKTVRLWDLEGNELAILPGHTDRISALALSPDGRHAVTIDENGNAQVWDLDGEEVVRIQDEIFFSGSFSSDSNRVITSGMRSHPPFTRDSVEVYATIWGLDGEEQVRLEGHSDTVWSALLSPNNDRAVTASTDGTIRLWDLAGNELVMLEPTQGELHPYSLALSPDGEMILFVVDSSARLWNFSGDEIAVFEPPDSLSITSVDFSPDGNMILTVSTDYFYDYRFQLWDLSGKMLSTFTYPGHLLTASFSPSGAEIVTSGDQSGVRIWDLAGNERLVTQPESDSIHGHSAAISPDGNYIVVGNSEGVSIWDMQGHLMVTLPEGKYAESVGFSPDGTKIMVKNSDNVGVWRWHPTIEDKLQAAQNRVSRGFSEQECARFFSEDLRSCPRSVEEIFGLSESYSE